jgi:hypothetical protein
VINGIGVDCVEGEKLIGNSEWYPKAMTVYWEACPTRQ